MPRYHGYNLPAVVAGNIPSAKHWSRLAAALVYVELDVGMLRISSARVVIDPGGSDHRDRRMHHVPAGVEREKIQVIRADLAKNIVAGRQQIAADLYLERNVDVEINSLLDRSLSERRRNHTDHYEDRGYSACSHHCLGHDLNFPPYFLLEIIAQELRRKGRAAPARFVTPKYRGIQRIMSRHNTEPRNHCIPARLRRPVRLRMPISL